MDSAFHACGGMRGVVDLYASLQSCDGVVSGVCDYERVTSESSLEIPVDVVRVVCSVSVSMALGMAWPLCICGVAVPNVGIRISLCGFLEFDVVYSVGLGVLRLEGPRLRPQR